MPVQKEGPYLAMAVFCERVLQEKDGTLSAIRIVDRITTTVTGPEVPEEMPPVSVNLKAFLAFKSGVASGKHSVMLKSKTPSGKEGGAFSMPIMLKGGEHGANLIISVDLQVAEEGVHWFDVLLDDHLVTRMPLTIAYRRVTAGMTPEGS